MQQVTPRSSEWIERDPHYLKRKDALLVAVVAYFNHHGPVSALQRAAVGRTDLLAVAAREVVRGGRHGGDCDYSEPDGACRIHLETFKARVDRLHAIAKEILCNR